MYTAGILQQFKKTHKNTSIYSLTMAMFSSRLGRSFGFTPVGNFVLGNNTVLEYFLVSFSGLVEQ
jgi:hypothetical protein